RSRPTRRAASRPDAHQDDTAARPTPQAPADIPDATRPPETNGTAVATELSQPVERRLLASVTARVGAVLERREALVAALVFGMALRVLHLVFNARNPEVNTPILDHQAYDMLAQRIVAGDWVGHQAFW